MHTVQTFVQAMHLKRRKIAPTLCKKRMKWYRQRHLHVNCPSPPTMSSTKIQTKLNQLRDLPWRIFLIEWFTCEQFPLSNDVSLDDQQHCSRFNQNACGHTPNFKSVIQLAPISITPATQPENIPTNNTHNQPDHASWAAWINKYICFCFFLIRLLFYGKNQFEVVTFKKSHTESCTFFTMYRCLIRSLAMSRCQSIVWKSSYWPIPGISSPSLYHQMKKKKKTKSK